MGWVVTAGHFKLVGLHGRFGWVRKISLPLGFDRRTVQPVASRHTDCRGTQSVLEYSSDICRQALVRLFFRWPWMLGFDNSRGISWSAERLKVSQEGIFSVGLGLEMKINLKRLVNIWVVGIWIKLIWPTKFPFTDCCEDGSEYSRFKNVGNLLNRRAKFSWLKSLVVNRKLWSEFLCDFFSGTSIYCWFWFHFKTEIRGI
jgi:hypothetical protein